MTRKLSARDRFIKEAMEKTMTSPTRTFFGRYRQLYGLLPSDPRCTACHAPFEGSGGAFVRTVLNKRRSQMNPLLCNTCEESARKFKAGVETEMSMLFADIRGSTPMAESMGSTQFKQVIDRFYSESTRVLSHSLALIGKLVGDEVSGFFFPSYVGKDFASVAVESAKELLRATGHAKPQGPWAPLGVGINTGEAYFGTVGTGDLIEITALGDEVNIAARLASQAAAGEILLSESTVQKAGLSTSGMGKRLLNLKGKSKPINAWVINISS